MSVGVYIMFVDSFLMIFLLRILRWETRQRTKEYIICLLMLTKFSLEILEVNVEDHVTVLL